MKIYKIAQTWEYDEVKRKNDTKIRKAFDEIREIMDRGVVHRDNFGIPVSFEVRDNSNPFGRAYVQLYYSNGSFNIETYYENEMVQDEYGKTRTIKIDPRRDIAGQIIAELSKENVTNKRRTEMNQDNDDTFKSMRSIRVTLDDGDVINTQINGTKKEIEDYYYNNEFVAQDENTMRKVVLVQFLD